MKQVKKYFNRKYLTLNLKKTNYLPFYLHDTSSPPFDHLVMDAHVPVLPANEIKYLGIMIDSKLKWHVHVNYTAKKIRKIIYRFKCLREILNYNQLKILYFSLIESHLSYGILGWGGVLDSHLNHLNLLQKRLLKIIYKKEFTYSSNDLFNESNVMDIRSLYFYQCVLYQWQSRVPIIPRKTTRAANNNNLRAPKTKTTCGQRCFTFLSIRAYNHLPKTIRQINTIKGFKNKAKDHILKTQRNEIHDVVTSIVGIIIMSLDNIGQLTIVKSNSAGYDLRLESV
ncbi:hypothetical protein NQ317_017937 [Molorchus minor]|uniref:Uncharacterized protein n=1 Tax=Molorchus minor TaxID=1323400 RepID=A0ABQ9JQY0_9CUCU|nr:hypothetical protein NQ317_017937 [Molorchus minor]